MELGQLKLQTYRKSWGQIVEARWNALSLLDEPYLDVGCSSGDYVRLLASQGAAAVGFDIQPNPNWSSAPELFTIGSAQSLPFPANSFETVFSFEVLEHLQNPEEALREMQRVSSRNVLVTVPDCEVPVAFRNSGLTYNHFSDPTHVQFFSEESLRQLFRSVSMEVVFIVRINPVRPEILHYTSQGLPKALVSILSRIARLNPFAKKYYMTLMALGVTAEEPRP